MTDAGFISDPVAGNVRTVPNGIAAATDPPIDVKISQASPSYLAAAAMNFVASITDPPPTASRKVISSCLIRSMALIAVAKRGFGSIPPNSTTMRSPSTSRTFAKTPVRSALPPPYRTMTLACAGICALRSAMRPFPKRICVGLLKSKLFMNLSPSLNADKIGVAAK